MPLRQNESLSKKKSRLDFPKLPIFRLRTASCAAKYKKCRKIKESRFPIFGRLIILATKFILDLFPFFSTMANPTNNANDVFDVRRVRRLVELMQENDLSELDIQQGDMRIQLKRGTVPVAAPGPQIPAPNIAPTFVPPSAPAVIVEEKNVQFIKSPMVGTFYSAPNPEAAAFIKVGDSVSPDKTVCLIEAMKVYNEIQAECSGKIIAVLVKNGESVEFGKPLFKISVE